MNEKESAMRPRAMLPVCLMLLSLAGCSGEGGTPEKPVTTVPVKGKVTLNGKPVTKGTIHFEPDYGRPAQGPIQADGSFVLTTYQADDGAVPGTHRVSVTDAGRAVPQKFTSAGSSRIEVEVTKDRTDYDVELK